MKKVLALAALAILCAVPSFAGTCAPLGQASDCNTLFTYNGTTVATSHPSTQPYDGVEDNYVGFLNNSNLIVNSITLTGSSIFGFDGDGAFGAVGQGPNACIASGVNTYGCGTGGNNNAAGNGTNDWYNGPGTTFTIVNSSNGSVTFIGGLQPGQLAVFSLEEAPSVGNATVTQIVATPEPGSM